MRKLYFACVAIVAALALSACTAAQNAQFQQDVAVFNQDITAINGAIANVSANLAQNCNAIAATGQALAQLVGTSKSAGAGIIAADAAITTWCQAVPQNIPQAVQATAAAVNAAKSAYASAKAGN